MVSGCLSSRQGLGDEKGSALARLPHLCSMISAFPQAVWFPTLLLQHGSGHLPGNEEEDPSGPVWLPQP